MTLQLNLCYPRIRVEAKQVLVMKKFPTQRIGKYCAQASHASLGALLSIGSVDEDTNSFVIPLADPFVKEWLVGRFKKVVLYVESDEELHQIYSAAKLANLPAVLIQDSGLTEYKGVPTLTAVGIGPSNPPKIDEITGLLKLF